MPVTESRTDQRIADVFAVSPSGVASQTTSRSPYLALATGSLAFVLGTVNVTVSNVAFPEIVRSFPGVSNGMTGWIIAGYSLVLPQQCYGGRLELLRSSNNFPCYRPTTAHWAGLAPSPLFWCFTPGDVRALTAIIPSLSSSAVPPNQTSELRNLGAAGMVAQPLTWGRTSS